MRSEDPVLAGDIRTKYAQNMAEQRLAASLQPKLEPTDLLTDPMAFSCGMRTNEQAVTVKTEPKDIEDLVVPTQFEQLTALGFGHMYDFDNLPELDPVYDFNGIKSEPGMMKGCEISSNDVHMTPTTIFFFIFLL